MKTPTKEQGQEIIDLIQKLADKTEELEADGFYLFVTFLGRPPVMKLKDNIVSGIGSHYFHHMKNLNIHEIVGVLDEQLTRTRKFRDKSIIKTILKDDLESTKAHDEAVQKLKSEEERINSDKNL